MQHLVVGADVNASAPVPAKVTASEGTVVALAGIADRDMRCDPATDQPAQKTARPVSRICGEPLWLQAEASLGAVEHRLGRFDLIIGARWRWLNVDNDRVLDVDE